MEGLLKLVGMKTLYRLGRVAGGVAWYLLPQRRKIVERNLRIVLDPALRGRELQKLSRENFKRTIANFLCSAKTATLTDEQLKKCVTIAGHEEFAAPAAERRGQVCAIAHSGNWEALARIRVFFPEVERYGSMYRQFDNPLMEEYVYKRRTERGTRMFSKEGGIKAPMKMVTEGGALGVLSDQFVWEGVYVPFFGKVTGTTPLPALLRKRTGADMVAIAVRTDSPGHWIADMGNVVDFSNSDGSLAGDTIEVNRSLETLIRKSVLDVFWMHHRWKSIDRFAPQDKKTDGLLENMELQPYRILVAVPKALDEALVTVPLVRALKAVRRDMQVKVEHPAADTYTFQADAVDLNYLETDEFLRKSGSLRGSVMIVGPLVARFGKALIPKPGGDKIGRRRLDTHFVGIQKLGACFSYDPDRQLYEIEAKKLKGAYMLLDEASVTGTANILMAAVLAEGKTTIYNAACEPYLQQLSSMLNRMGARISGVGSNLLTIEGVEALGGTTHTILPDMIEVGSFIGMAAMTGSDITIKNTGYDMLGIIPDSFRRLGITVEQIGDDIHVPTHDSYQIETFIDGSIMTIADAPWPGLTPDLLSVFLVVATQAVGSVLIHQKMFESRLFFVDKLIDMGAQIILCDPHRATVIGLGNRFKLRGSNMVSPDIRAGIALLIAAMSAEGTSHIHNIDQIDRGYQNIDKRLNGIGARITRL